jgi:hypothetical protein
MQTKLLPSLDSGIVKLGKFNTVEMVAPPNKKPFDELPVSTITVMVYSNIYFELNRIFESIPLTVINPPLTKKKKNIDKKKLTAPYGAIISSQFGIYIRGLRLSKKKKYWCPMCQLYDDDGKKIPTIDEEIHPLEENEKCLAPPETRKILFFCHTCEKYISTQSLRKIIPFLNQVTIVLSIGGILINIMIFKDSCKIAGSKTFEDATETLMILWEEFIQPLTPSLLLKNPLDTTPLELLPNWRFRNDIVLTGDSSKNAHFLFEPVMMNVDFSIGYPIDKSKFNSFMNKKEYKDRIFLSFCEKTSSTHVNVKMYANKPDNYKFFILCYENAGIQSPKFLMSTEKMYHRKKPKEKYTTFIVFSSSQVILTGRYTDNMEDNYEFFMNETQKHKNEITENVSGPKMSIFEYMKNQKIGSF